jgi:GPH family glycoside/pentoside/hexuronide:cation symporter
MPSSEEKPPQPSDNRLPMREKIAWGMGGFSDQLAANGLNNLFVPIYNIGFGMSSVLIGWAVSIPRFFDMISDPIVGNLSDNCRSRFGRRRPFIFAGGFLMAFAFGVSYMASPDWGHAALFAFAVSACIFFYFMYTLFAVPYNALGLELTSDYDERADVQKYRLIFASVATFLIPWLYKICLSAGEFIREFVTTDQSAWYGFIFQPVVHMATNDDVKVEVLGIRYVAWTLAVIVALSALPVSLFTREKARVESQDKMHLFRSGRLALQNRSFRTLGLMIFFVISGMFFMGVLVTYANIFYIFDGDKSSGATWNGFYGTVSGITSLCATFAIPLLVRRFDKKKVLMAGLTLASITILCSWFLLQPSQPALQLVLAVVIGAGMSTVWLLNGAFIADICDEDELLNGCRREGIFSAFYGFMVKLAFTGIAFTLGYVLTFIGYEAGAEKMTPETLTRLRLFIALFPSACLIAAIITFSRYQLSRERLHEIQAAIRERREAASAESGAIDPPSEK